MNTLRFNSIMTKFQPVIKGEDLYTTFTLKVIEETSIHSLPQQFKSQIDLGDCFAQSSVNDCWDKINIPVNEYRLKYKVTFDVKEFEAKLENIAAVKKVDKTGVPTTEFTLTFVKELDKDLDPILSLYLKRKEDDPEASTKGKKLKKKLIQFNTVLEEK